MPPPLITFGTLAGIESVSMTESHGVSASLATITSHKPPPANFIAVNDLRIDTGLTQIVWPSAALLDVQFSAQAGQTWTYQIADRRWRWAFGEISGHYNVRLADGSIDEDTEKTDRELVELCLVALNANISAQVVSDDLNTEVHWDREKPATALTQLLDRQALRIMPTRSGSFKLARHGELSPGTNIDLALAESYGQRLSGKAAADRVTVYSAPVEYQKRLALDAVGYEHATKEVLPIDELYDGRGDGWRIGYAPAASLPVDATEDRKWANETVYRWFRITGDIGADGTIDGFPVEEFVFFNRQLETDHNGTTDVARPPQIYGRFTSTLLDRKELNERYDGQVTYDEKLRVFKTGEALYLSFRESASGLYYDKAPELVGELAYIHAPGGVPKRRAISRVRQGTPYNTGDHVVKVGEAVPTSYLLYQGDSPTTPITPAETNFEDIDRMLSVVADDELRTFELRVGEQAPLIGIVPLELDGKLEQITWSVSAQGWTTTFSMAAEHDEWQLTYDERAKLLRDDQAYRELTDKLLADRRTDLSRK